MLDPEYVKKFGNELAEMVPDNWQPGYFLDEVQKILATPRLAIAPDTLAAALTATIKDKTMKSRIFEQLKKGNFDLLKEHLPEKPEQFGFKPERLLGLPPNETRQYYIDALKDSYRTNDRLNKLMALSILSQNTPPNVSLKDYLRQMNEGTLEPLISALIRKKYLDQFVAESDRPNALKRVLDTRLKKFSNKLRSHTIGWNEPSLKMTVN